MAISHTHNQSVWSDWRLPIADCRSCRFSRIARLF
jgi:hypothetical protein